MTKSFGISCLAAAALTSAVPSPRADAYAIADAVLDFNVTAVGHTKGGSTVSLGTWTWGTSSVTSSSSAYFESPIATDGPRSATGSTSASSSATSAPGDGASGGSTLTKGAMSGAVADHSHSAVTLPAGTYASANNSAFGNASFKIAFPGTTDTTQPSYIKSWDLNIQVVPGSGLTIDFSTLPGLGGGTGLFAGGSATYQYNVTVNTANQGHKSVSVGDTIFADDYDFGFSAATSTFLPGITRDQTKVGSTFVGSGFTPYVTLDWSTSTSVQAANLPEGGATLLMLLVGIGCLAPMISYQKRA